MYTPKLFLETDRERLHHVIEGSGAFGALITTDERGGIEIAHLPFLFDPGAGPLGTLRVHVARANRIWRYMAEGRPVTVVFEGPHGYVSPRWYEHSSEQVPTWNYAVVHIHGRAEGPMDREELLRLLGDLAAYHERGAERPWAVSDLDPSFREGLLQEIVGMTIQIERIEGKFKLSQNRSAIDHDRVARAFEERGRPDDLEMARLMAPRRSR